MKTFFVSFLIFFASLLHAQSVERKIIIQNGKYFYTTLPEDIQLATLHTGRLTEALKDGKKLALPAGRNFDDPIIPFAWDVLDTSFYAVSFFAHPLNDRNEAIKRMNINSLKESGKFYTPLELINISVEMTPYAYNDPYQFVIKRSNIMSGFFFDGIATDKNSYTMAISNNGELSIWNYNGSAWKHSEVFKFPVDNYFSLFEKNNKTYLITSGGSIYEASLNGVTQIRTKLPAALTDGFLVIDKDAKTVSFMKSSDLNKQTPLNELITKKATKIF